MSDTPWVTDPVAIETIINLGALRAGDEILFGPDKDADNNNDVAFYGHTCTVREVQTDTIRLNGTDTFFTVYADVVSQAISKSRLVTLKNIHAWRRPHAQKT